MKPLRQECDSADPNVAAAARLIRQVGPLAHSRRMQRRVRYQLESRQAPPAARAFRLAVVVGVVCGLAATAGAAWGVLRATSPEPEREGGVLEAPVAPRALPAPPKRVKSLPALPLPPEQTFSEPADPAFAPAASVPRSPARPVIAKSTKPAPPTASSEAALVHRAVKELRGGGDPERARQLLEQYRASHPTGELAEEALVLSIEAAVAKGEPDARRLARQYLAKYPNGRFVAAARRVLE